MRRFIILSFALAACTSSSSGSGEQTDFERGELTQCLVDSGTVTAGCVDDYGA